MVTHFNDKGKIFTEVVQKTPIWATLQMPDRQIHGLLHVTPDRRVIEEMNSQQLFLALTQVDVYSADGKEKLFSSRFLVVNKQHICWIAADEDREEEQPR